MTQQALMLLPMVIMVFLTFGMMFWMLKLRYRAVLKDGFDPKYFRVYDSSHSSVPMPDYLIKVTLSLNGKCIKCISKSVLMPEY